jgi:hypothetical protein
MNERTIPVSRRHELNDMRDWDQFGYEVAYYVEERGQLTGDVLCIADARTYLAGWSPEDDEEPTVNDEFGIYPAFQINGEVGDTESVWCDDCGELIYAGAEFNYDKSNAA